MVTMLDPLPTLGDHVLRAFRDTMVDASMQDTSLPGIYLNN